MLDKFNRPVVIGRRAMVLSDGGINEGLTGTVYKISPSHKGAGEHAQVADAPYPDFTWSSWCESHELAMVDEGPAAGAAS
jgi:hypothetical protein